MGWYDPGCSPSYCVTVSGLADSPDGELRQSRKAENWGPENMTELPGAACLDCPVMPSGPVWLEPF